LVPAAGCRHGLCTQWSGLSNSVRMR
jgi:hypothetical protein